MSFARLIVVTQVRENYGSPEAPHWKSKGGSEYVVAVLDIAEAAKGMTHLETTYVRPALSTIEHDGEMMTEAFLGWELLWEGELTWTEQCCVDYDGRIDQPAIGVGQGGDGPWCPIFAGALLQRRHSAYAA